MKSSTLALSVAGLLAPFSIAHPLDPLAGSLPPAIHKLGTADFSIVEITPVVWKGGLLRFESVRSNYGVADGGFALGSRDPAMGNADYYRFRDVVTLETTASFAPGYSFGCAFVQKASERADGVDTMWAFGRGPNTTQIGAWSSTDLKAWTAGPGLQLGGFGHTANDYEAFNNAVHVGRTGHVMAIELGKPSDITGTPFTSVFATHSGDDLSKGWVFLDPHTHVYPPIAPTHGYMGACPTIRYVAEDDNYYMWNLHSKGRGYGDCLVRSKDLITWEASKLNPILDYTASGEVAADKGKAPRVASWNYYANFTTAMEAYIAGASDINESDIDFCDVENPDGTSSVYISYSWGNQRGTEFLGAAEVKNATVSSWLTSYF